MITQGAKAETTVMTAKTMNNKLSNANIDQEHSNSATHIKSRPKRT